MKVCIALLFFAVALANARVWLSPRPLVEPIGPPPEPTTRIVGGHEEVTPHHYPHQVAIHIDNMYFCGGSLISMEYVLTAAHCTDGHSMAQVTAGAHNQAKHESMQQIKTSYNLIVHEQYNHRTFHNDVALIRMQQPFQSNQYIRTICMNGAQASPGSVTPTGWGLTSDSQFAQLSDVLMAVTVPVMANSQCKRYFSNIYEGHICTDASGGHGTCNGDSGGPLNGGGRTYGITSFGSSRGCTSGYPDVFTRVSYFAGWVTRHTGVSPC